MFFCRSMGEEIEILNEAGDVISRFWRHEGIVGVFPSSWVLITKSRRTSRSRKGHGHRLLCGEGLVGVGGGEGCRVERVNGGKGGHL